jgi:hypothetical protein
MAGRREHDAAISGFDNPSAQAHDLRTLDDVLIGALGVPLLTHQRGEPRLIQHLNPE